MQFLFYCEALDIPHLRVSCQTALHSQAMLSENQTRKNKQKVNMVIVKKDYVNLKDTSKKAAVHQPAVKSWESRVPQHIKNST